MPKKLQTKPIAYDPTRRGPEGHRWCMACDGDGRSGHDRRKKCEVCQGKGYWNAQDIDQYHASRPRLCREQCGKAHRPTPRILTAAEEKKRDQEIRDGIKALKKLLARRKLSVV